MRLFLALFLLLVATLSQADTGSVYIVLSDNNKLYQQAAQAVQAELKMQGFSKPIHISSIQSLHKKALHPKDLLVPLGQQAALNIHYSFERNSHLYSFIDRTQIPPHTDSEWAAVVIDQPVQRLFDLASTIVSGRYRDKVIVAISEENQLLRDEISKLNNQSGIPFEVLLVDKNSQPAKVIDKALFNAGALLAVRDEHIWSGENAKWMLYQSYKFNVPVIGYSKRFLKAGALASVYATLPQTTDKTVQLIMQWEQQGMLTEHGIVYPNFEIEFNKNIARALKITIPEILPEGNKN